MNVSVGHSLSRSIEFPYKSNIPTPFDTKQPLRPSYEFKRAPSVLLEVSNAPATRGVQDVQDQLTEMTKLQIANRGVSGVTDTLAEMQKLVTQAQSATLTDAERGDLDTKYQAYKTAIDQTVADTTFEGASLLDGSITGIGPMDTEALGLNRVGAKNLLTLNASANINSRLTEVAQPVVDRSVESIYQNQQAIEGRITDIRNEAQETNSRSLFSFETARNAVESLSEQIIAQASEAIATQGENLQPPATTTVPPVTPPTQTEPPTAIPVLPTAKPDPVEPQEFPTLPSIQPPELPTVEIPTLPVIERLQEPVKPVPLPIEPAPVPTPQPAPTPGPEMAPEAAPAPAAEG